MNCKVAGYEYKTLEVELLSGESFYAERGSIVYVEEGLQRDVEFNTGGGRSSGLGRMIGGVLKSALSGESILIIHFYNPTNVPKKVVLCGSCCSLLPIKLRGESLICRRGHYVGSTDKMNLNINLSMQGILGGVGFFQKIDGEGTVFLDSLGSPLVKVLGSGDAIEVDENHIVALLDIPTNRIAAGWSVGNVLRGEGISLMKIYGPGTVYLSPLPILPMATNS